MRVTVHVAKTTLSKLIERARAGEGVIIARGKTPVVRLVPIGEHAPERRPISVQHAERAGQLPIEPRDPFDRMLIAQAQSEGLARQQ
jgi:antitoxin (DNA-binding transcriptional repressor) of toxin-antitoxin stability system